MNPNKSDCWQFLYEDRQVFLPFSSLRQVLTTLLTECVLFLEYSTMLYLALLSLPLVPNLFSVLRWTQVLSWWRWAYPPGQIPLVLTSLVLDLLVALSPQILVYFSDSPFLHLEISFSFIQHFKSLPLSLLSNYLNTLKFCQKQCPFI